jgi:hypothetical protein
MLTFLAFILVAGTVFAIFSQITRSNSKINELRSGKYGPKDWEVISNATSEVVAYAKEKDLIASITLSVPIRSVNGNAVRHIGTYDRILIFPASEVASCVKSAHSESSVTYQLQLNCETEGTAHQKNASISGSDRDLLPWLSTTIKVEIIDNLKNR